MQPADCSRVEGGVATKDCELEVGGLDFGRNWEGTMKTGRTFLGSVGAAAALGVAGGAAFGGEMAAVEDGVKNMDDAERGSADAAASSEKMLFWVAVSTPCDRNLNFDPELCKDLLAYLKAQGADGWVVLGTSV